jgi:hypothetical protein
LFSSLHEKDRTSIAEFTSFSYLASLDLFLNAHQQEDFENCVNKDVIDNPNQWTTAFITNHSAFKNWANAEKIDVAAATGAVI